MIDLIIGKSPSMNKQDEQLTTTVQQEIREALQLVRKTLKLNGKSSVDRRKNTRDRRRESVDDVIVRLSSRSEKRTRLDRRQNMELLNASRETGRKDQVR